MTETKKILLNCGEEIRWPKGLCLKTTVRSCFIIPGGIFQNGIPFKAILEISDDETLIYGDKPTSGR